MAGKDHLLIKGLVDTLPPVGTEWPDAERDEWAKAALGNFNLVYKRPKSLPSSSEEGSSD